MAQRGTLFSKSYSLSPWTVPSFSGIFTSKYPPSLTPGAPDEQPEHEEHLYGKLPLYWLEKGDATFIDRLRSADGYQTTALFGNPAIAIFLDWFHRDFDASECLHNSTGLAIDGPFVEFPIMSGVLRQLWPDWYQELPIDTTRIVLDKAREALRQAGSRPFFLWVHFMDPHGPYNPPAEYRSEVSPWAYFPLQKDFDRPDFLSTLRPDDARHAKSLYEGEIRYVDYAVGELLRELEHTGLEDSTYICFTSDHGEGQATHFFLYHPLPLQAVVSDGHKLIRNLVSGERLLFDLQADPLEQTNLSSAQPEVANRLNGLLDTWQAPFPSIISKLYVAPKSGQETGTSEENKQHLKDIGYVR